jgi:flagellar basal-body rod protein FlgC
MDIIANNIANIDTTRTETGGPYRRQLPVFEERRNRPFSFFLNEKMNSRGKGGVQVSAIIEDQSPFKIIYNPAHPDADEDGYVSMPNVDIVTEMVDMIDASRAYEANVTALNSLKNMALKALEIGKG